MILKGISGVLIGAAYGALVGALTFQVTRIGRDPAYPGPLIPDANGMARFAVEMAILITGTCGILVGLIVGLSGVGKGRAGAIGFGLGLLVLVLLSMNSWTALLRGSLPEWRNMLVLLIILPCGLALTGMVVSAVAGKLNSYS